MDSLKEKTAKGLLWGMLNNGSTQVLNLVFGIFLGRLLSPSDYGMVGVLTIFAAIAGNLQSSGFTQALTNMKAPTPRDYNAVFWFNVTVSLSIYAILFLCAPLIAAFFHQPELTLLSRVVFLSFVISSFGIAHGAYMFKNMMIRETTITGFAALVVSGAVGVGLAFAGKAYWSLAWQQIIYITIINLGRYYYTPWRPSLRVDLRPIAGMFGFSVKILVTSIINTLNANVLIFIFGRLYPMRAVGNFTQANKWNAMAYSFLSGAVAQVAQPVMASIRDDKERARRAFRKMLRLMAFLSFPAMFGLAMTADEFIRVTIGDGWADSVPLLRLLCVGGAFMPLYTLYQNLMISRGRSDVYMWCTVAQVVAQLAVVAALADYGMTTMVWAYTALNVVFLAAWQYFLRRLLGVKTREVAADICPFMLVSAGVMALTWALTRSIDSPWALLPCRVALAAALYFAAMRIAGAGIMRECLDFLRKRKTSDE